jgi:hypothetical protein
MPTVVERVEAMDEANPDFYRHLSSRTMSPISRTPSRPPSLDLESHHTSVTENDGSVSGKLETAMNLENLVALE